MSNISASDITVYPAKGDFPISIQGTDPDGRHAFYFVKKEDAQVAKYRTHLAIKNTSGGTLTLTKTDPEPHFVLRFRPGLVNAEMVRQMMPLANELQNQMGAGWQWDGPSTNPFDGVIAVNLSYKGDDPFHWDQDTVLSLQLRPVPIPPLSGAFFLKMELDYSGVVDDATINQRELNLAAIDLSGSTFFPLTARVDGSNSVLNDGAGTNDRSIWLWNNQPNTSVPLQSNASGHEMGTSITVAIPCYDGPDAAGLANHPEVLGTKTQVSGINMATSAIIANPESSSGWPAPTMNDDIPGWISWEITISPDQNTWYLNGDVPPTASNDILSQLQFNLTNIISGAPDGIANVYIHFHYVPGYADHTLIVPLEKTPIVVRGQNIGIGTSGPHAPLQFANNVANRKIVLYENDNNDHQYYGLGINGYTLRYQVPGNTYQYAHKFFAGVNSSSSKELMRIQGDGTVGIGNTSPLGPLSIGNSAVDGSDGFLVIGKNTGGGHSRHFKIGFDDAFNFIIGDFGSNNAAGTWKSQFSINYGAPANSLLINSSGNVGIGTDGPSAKLEIDAGGGYTVGLIVNGRIQSKGSGGVWVDSDKKKFVGDAGSNQIGFYNNKSWRLKVGDDGTVYVSTGRIKDKTGDVIPVGSILAYGGSTAPEGWLLCDGSAIPAGSDYDDLRTALGNGVTKVPLLSGKFIMGVDGPDYALNDVGGEATHILAEDEIPSHSHLGVGLKDNSGWDYGASAEAEYDGVLYESSGAAYLFETSSTGSGNAHNNLPPYYVLTYIIKY